MAQIVIGKAGCPTCAGCGAEFHFVPYQLDSRHRGIDPQYETAYERGNRSEAQEIAAFAEQHRGCDQPPLVVTQLSCGITCTDKRAPR